MSKQNNFIFEEGETKDESLKLNEIYYNCTECSSPIEILSINEKDNIIEFECINNKHKKNISIKEYIDKMKQFNVKKINNDICIEHNKQYECICLECNKHLCKECLKTRKHINHQKINIIEIQPNKEELKIIDNIINNKYEDKDNIQELEIKRLYEIIFNSYDMFNNNYYNSMNINKIISNYYKNHLKMDYENKIKIIKEIEKTNQIIVDCENTVNNITIEKEIEINNIKNENKNKINQFENNMKELKTKYDNFTKEVENELNAKNKEIENILI